MANPALVFSEQLSASDPQHNPVLIIGQPKLLSQIRFSHLKAKLEPRVSQEVFENAVESLRPSPTDSCSLYLNLATIAALPKNCSRHNTPSRSHAITKIVKSCTTGNDEFIVVICEKRDVFASACAIARAFPLFSRKGKSGGNSRTVVVEFLIHGVDGEFRAGQLSESDIECITLAAEGIRAAARIIDTPCNEMNTDDFLQEVKNVGASLGIVPQIIRGEELKERGFGGIYNVGKAAAHPPALAILSHSSPTATETIAFVGKGIVYDTGGLCIKSKTFMCGMKRDCGGAAGMLEAFFVAVKLGFKENLHVILCLAENSVGPDSMRPDDIITLHSGRTVEVNNTDAEGRLVLGDGVSYAEKDLKATIIVDMATLTSAQGTATGKYHASVLTNSDIWEQAIVTAGRTSGDLVHPVPFCPELHFSEFGSALADMKNSAADRNNAQPSCGGLFIGAHIGFDYPGSWIHIDMACTSYFGERATGYGVALLLTLFGHASKNPMLQSLSPLIAQNGPDVETASKKIRLA